MVKIRLWLVDTKEELEREMVGTLLGSERENLFRNSPAYFTFHCLACARYPRLVIIFSSEGGWLELTREACNRGWQAWKRRQVTWWGVSRRWMESWECLFMVQNYVEYCSGNANQLSSCLLMTNQKEMASINITANLSLKGRKLGNLQMSLTTG